MLFDKNGNKYKPQPTKPSSGGRPLENKTIIDNIMNVCLLLATIAGIVFLIYLVSH